MTIYDDMRGYVHTHDRNGWFDVIAKTTPMYQMIDKADAENAKLRKYAKLMHDHINECCNACGERCICDIDALTRELGIEVEE